MLLMNSFHINIFVLTPRMYVTCLIQKVITEETVGYLGLKGLSGLGLSGLELSGLGLIGLLRAKMANWLPREELATHVTKWFRRVVTKGNKNRPWVNKG